MRGQKKESIMVKSSISQTGTYQPEDVQQILQLAMKRQQDSSELTREQLLEIASDLGINTDDLAAAEQEWLSHKEEYQDQLVFNQVRREQLQQSLVKYGIVNTFLVILNVVTSHTISWSLPILILWGLGVTLKAWKTSQTQGEAYQQEFQRWRLRKQVEQSIGNLTDKLRKVLQF